MNGKQLTTAALVTIGGTVVFFFLLALLDWVAIQPWAWAIFLPLGVALFLFFRAGYRAVKEEIEIASR